MDKADELEILARETYDVYLQSGALNDLELSIQRFQQLLNLTPDDDRLDRARRLNNLAIGYSDRYEQLGALSDLEAAIQCGQQAVDLTPDDHPKQPDRLYNLAIDYANRHKQLGTLSDLEAAIRCDQQAVDLTPDEDHPKRAARLNNLGINYCSRYEQLGALSDIEAAIQCSQQAVDLTLDEDHLKRAARLNTHGINYSSRYRRLGTLSDLEAAIQCDRQALHLTPENHPTRVRLLGSLGVSYTYRYLQTGALPDLELSIQLDQEALDLTPEGPDRARRIGSLGIGYQYRYQRTEALSDLELSIQLDQEALDLTPEGPDRARRLQNLGIGYHYRYQRTEALSDLELFIQLLEEAIDLTPINHSDRADQLQNLGIGYHYRYRQTGALSDLELSIRMHEEAVNLTPENHPDRAERLQGLGVGYSTRCRRKGTLDDLELYIQQFQKALDLTSDNHLDRASRLQSLGIGYRDRYRQTGALGDLERAIKLDQEALNHESSPPDVRFLAGKALFNTYAEAENWALAYDIASLTVSLIPLLILRSLERSDIQHRANEVIGVASEATTIALRAGKSVYEAIQLLEVSRGIIANSLGDIRTNITDLDEKFPHLAEQFNSLRNLLDSPKELRQDAQRYKTGKQLEELIQKIRSIPSFDRFLLAPGEDDMKKATFRGPIVIINTSKYGCQALIIEEKGFQALELSLKMEDIQIQADKLASPDTEMLEWLWRRIAYPVLTLLGFVRTPQHTWPRIWWILTGALARFPIHAAGCYSENGDEIHGTNTVMDLVVSSYSPSVRAIIDANRNISVPMDSSTEQSMVLVGMTQTPGYGSLQFAQREIDMLAKIGTSMQLQVKSLSLRKETLLAMKGCKIFHFAGHGYTDVLDPSNSALLLSDGRLTVDSIFDLNLRQDKPFLAYLSACGTGQVKHKLIDEGLHLISACQLAGFRHAIGTLWEVNDESCVDVAKMTYGWMRKQGLSDSSVSEGLHHACRALRKKWIQENETRVASKRGTQVKRSQEQPCSVQTEARDLRDIEFIEELPMHWVPYVHFGI